MSFWTVSALSATMAEPPQKTTYLVSRNHISAKLAVQTDTSGLQDSLEKCISQIDSHKRAELEATIVTEFIKLSKREVSAVIGPGASKILHICKSTQCRIAALPVSSETINVRIKGQDLPQTLSLTGRTQEIVQAKVLLRKAIVESKSG